MKKYLNESLPQEQRLGQIGMSNKYGEMKIIEYRNSNDIDVCFKEYSQIVRHKAYSNFLKGKVSIEINHKKRKEFQTNTSNQNEEMIILNYENEKDIDVLFLHNWEVVKTTYTHFKCREVENPLYHKERYEGQIRISNQGQWMRLLIWNNTKNCVVEFEDGTLVDCDYVKFNKGSVANPNYVKPSENEFYYNDKLECWVGVTKKGEEFLFSHPDERIVEYVKSCTWYVNHNKYIATSTKGWLLHHIILPLTKEAKKQGYDRIDHINNNPLDNRYENLRYSNAKENARNRKPSGKSGITGLIYVNNCNKWYGRCFRIGTKYYKDKNEALIDLLILQKHFKVTHNEHLFHLLDDIPQQRIDYVENYIKEKIEKQNNNEYKINCCNTFERIDDDTYKMYDSKGRSCLVDAEDVERIKLGNWHGSLDSSNKQYFNGSFSRNNRRDTTAVHRYILNLINAKYSGVFVVDHINGDESDNTKKNLVITDYKGNMINRFGKGYTLNKDMKYISIINLNKYNKTKSFRTKQEAIDFYNHYKQILLNGRLQWKTKEELDKWIKDVEDNGLTIDKAMEQHYEKLYNYVGELIEKEHPKKARRKKIA